MKKRKEIRQHQRQRVSRKTIIIICALSLSCFAITTILFFNLAHVDKTKATDIPMDENLCVVQEQTFITDKEISAPVTRQQAVTNSNTVLVKPSKSVTSTSSSSH